MANKSKSPQPAAEIVMILRKQIRDVLSALPKDKQLPKCNIGNIIQARGYEFKPAHLDEAMEWNHSRNFIDYEHNHDFDREEWHLTEKGRAHDE